MYSYGNTFPYPHRRGLGRFRSAGIDQARVVRPAAAQTGRHIKYDTFKRGVPADFNAVRLPSDPLPTSPSDA